MSDLERAIGGDVSGWQGLPARVAPAEVGPGDWDPEPRVRAGRVFRVWRVGGADIEAYADPEGEVVVVEVGDPGPVDWEALGEPEMVRPSRVLDLHGFTEDLVFAGRGITVTIARPHEADVEDGTVADPAPRVRRLQLYAATDATTWLTDLGPPGEPDVRPFPRR